MTGEYTGPNWQEDAYITGVVMREAEGQFTVGLADGRLITRLIDKPETVLSTITAHDGLVALIPGFASNDMFSIGEDGRVLRHIDGEITELAKFEKTWLEQITLFDGDELIAVSAKKNVWVLDCKGKQLAHFADHPSSVTGVAFDAKGKRLAASHYNGVTLWYVHGGADQTPQRLNWKGSHLGLNWSPNGKFLLSFMQENALHGWRPPGYEDFQMSGYAIKPRSLSWSHDDRWLASSGSPGIVCWDCAGKGPMGRPAKVLGQDCPDLTSATNCHPSLDLVAAGTVSGLVYLSRFQDDNNVWLKTHSTKEITVLRWSSDGSYLFAAHEDGQANMWHFDH